MMARASERVHATLSGPTYSDLVQPIFEVGPAESRVVAGSVQPVQLVQPFFGPHMRACVRARACVRMYFFMSERLDRLDQTSNGAVSSRSNLQEGWTESDGGWTDA